MKDQQKFTAAVIGAGRVGNYHTLAQIELSNDVVIYDVSTERAQVIAKQHPSQVRVAASLEEAIQVADVVHICTPPMYHLDGVLASVAYDKPTIVEKPLAFKLEEAIQIYRAIKQTTAPVILATSFRVTPSLLAICDAVRSGTIGTVGSLETSYVHDVKYLENGATWRKQLESTAFLYEGGTHAVDLNLWLAGQPVTEVQAMVGSKKTRHEYRWDDDIAISLKYEDGTIGRVWVNAAAPLPRHGSSVAIYGERGAYRAHSKFPFYESYLEREEDVWIKHVTDIKPTMKVMSAIFNDYIQGRRDNFEPMPSLEEGLRLMLVLDTIEKSLNSGVTEKIPRLEDILQDNVEGEPAVAYTA